MANASRFQLLVISVYFILWTGLGIRYWWVTSRSPDAASKAASKRRLTLALCILIGLTGIVMCISSGQPGSVLFFCLFFLPALVIVYFLTIRMTGSDLRRPMPMRFLKIDLAIAALVCVASAISGIQWISYDSRTGTQISYFAGWDRLWTVGGAILLGLGAWGIHRRIPAMWTIGWVVLFASAAVFVFATIRMLLPQPYGWVGVLGALVAVILGTVYEGIWWQRHREYFTREGVPPDWSDDK
jgi:hypothetical protein